MNKRSIISIHGGLGNQLFQLGLAESLVNYSSVLILPWKKYCRVDEYGKMWISHYELSARFIGKSSFGDRFLINYARVCHKLLLRVSDEKFFGQWLRILYLSFIKLPRILGIGIVVTSELGEFTFPKLLRRNYFVAYYQTQKAAVLIAQSITMDNKVKFALPSPVREHQNQILIIHIRRTDYKDNPDIGLLPRSYYSNALNLVSTKLSWDELWLFSDDLDEAKKMIPTEFTSKMRPIQSFDFTPVEVLSQMSLGDAYILSNSTFGWWASNLAERKPLLVVAPKVWFENIPEPKGLIPSDWIRL